MILSRFYRLAVWPLLLLGLVACGGTAVTDTAPTGLLSDPPPTTAAVAESPEIEPEVEPSQPTEAELPPASGGGAATSGLVAEPESLPVDGLPTEPMDVFSGTAFVLNTSLPTEPTTAVRYEIPGQDLTLESATAMAERFGFTGPLYQEQLPGDLTITDEGNTFVPQMPFMAYQGTERLTVAPGNLFYEDTAVAESYPSQIGLAEAQAAAEAFLNGRGWLDFAYEARAGYAGDVFFHELIDGVLLETPRMVVHVNDDGQVVRLSYTPNNGLTALETTTLITAEAAWAQVQEGVRANQLAYTLLPIDAESDEPLPPNLVSDQRWVRERPAGGEAILYGYPTVLRNATDPNAAPRVQLLGYELVGTPEQLAELANTGGQNTAVQGTISPDGQQLLMRDWDLVSLQPLSVRGQLSQAGEQVVVTDADGQTYSLPNPPADIVAETAGQIVDIFAWDAVATSSDLLQLEWETIQVAVGEPGAGVPEPAVSSFMPLEAFPTYEEATVDAVRLVYFVAPQVSEAGVMPEFDFPPQVLQPMWEFSGAVDGQDTLRIYVPAVADGS